MDYKFVADIATELHMNKANLFKLIKDLGIEKIQIRKPPHNQKMAAVTNKDYKKIIKYRSEFEVIEDKSNKGVFYLIQMYPEINENRVKFGFAQSIKNRIRSHQTTLPTLKLVKTWEVNPSDEATIIKLITTQKDKRLSLEVFELHNLKNTIDRINAVYNMLND